MTRKVSQKQRRQNDIYGFKPVRPGHWYKHLYSQVYIRIMENEHAFFLSESESKITHSHQFEYGDPRVYKKITGHQLTNRLEKQFRTFQVLES
jgi:hypothetical protein